MFYRVLFNGLLYNRRPTNDVPRLVDKNDDYIFTRFEHEHSAFSDVISNIASCFLCCKNKSPSKTKIELSSPDGTSKDITDFVLKRAYRNMLIQNYEERILKSFFTKMIFHDVNYDAFFIGRSKTGINIPPLYIVQSDMEIWDNIFAIGCKTKEEASFLTLSLSEDFKTNIIFPPSRNEINFMLNYLKCPENTNVS